MDPSEIVPIETDAILIHCQHAGAARHRGPADCRIVVENRADTDLADDLWLVGSPDTVIDKIMALQEKTGGFGYLIVVSYDSKNELTQWECSLRLSLSKGCSRPAPALKLS
jgi:alkanesulfonate monooxygenase SsuD/methylene tetrahydromethanopterin reductase-like flavin-dependent oxidoreductase (luciferase family)